MLKERTIDWTRPEAYSKPPAKRRKTRKKNPNGSWFDAAVLLGAFLLGWTV